jgi:hypothetical protein
MVATKSNDHSNIQKQHRVYSGQIAETGHASAQVPQLVQMVASMV